jgi:hypothetical protein
MKHKWLLKYALPAILIGVLFGGGAYQIWQRSQTQTVTVNCANPIQGCQFQLGQQQVHVNFIDTPSGLHPFTVRVNVADAKVIYAYFTMPDMEMGYNRYRLISSSPQLWQARVVLPVCVTGRRDWILTLDIDGKTFAIPFSG